MAGRVFSYRSQGFSLQREKNRFVLPAQIRNTVRESSGDKPVLCLVKHDRWPCLMGFGLSRADDFEEELDKEERRAIEFGKPFDREIKAMQLYSFSTVPFDGSGRFVMPDHLAALAGIRKEIFFNGLGSYFTIWAREELAGMGEEFAGLQANCDVLAREAQKGRG